MSAVGYGMVVDTRTCVACAACVIACKTENDVAEGFSRDWIFTGSRIFASWILYAGRSQGSQQPGCAASSSTKVSFRVQIFGSAPGSRFATW